MDFEKAVKISDNTKLHFGSDADAYILYDETVTDRLVIDGTAGDTAAGIEITGSIYAADIASGSLAGLGSYVGLDSNNKLVLTSSQDLTPDLSGDVIIGTDCTNYLHISSSLTATCDSFFSASVTLGADCEDIVFISGSLTASCCGHRFLGPVVFEQGTESCQIPEDKPAIKFVKKTSPDVVYHTLGVSGSWLSGTQGITEMSGGIDYHTGSNTYSRYSSSGSYTTGSDGVVVIEPGKIEVYGTIRATTLSTANSVVTDAGYVGAGLTGGDVTHRVTLPNTSDEGGRILANAFTTYSSRRYKTDITKLSNPIDTLSKLEGVGFKWKDTGKQDYGFIAEEAGEGLARDCRLGL